VKRRWSVTAFSDNAQFYYGTVRDFVDVASPCNLRCLLLVYAARMVWEWNNDHAIQGTAYYRVASPVRGRS
jgi:hypothetical protein